MLTENTFAAACYDQNSLAELIHAFNNLPDRTDIKTWGLTENEYYAALQQAIEAKQFRADCRATGYDAQFLAAREA